MPAEPVIPPTQPYPGRNSGIPYADGGGYDIIVSNADTGVIWWTVPYWGQNGLAMYPGMGGWVDGDRQGYVCAYGHILDVNGDVVGRFHATEAVITPPRAEGGAYAKVNDRYMAEAQRYLDGTIANSPGNELQDEDCFDGKANIDAQGICDANPGLDERPRVAFFDTHDRVLDIRDYTNTDSEESRFILADYQPGVEATVLACDTVTGEAAITFTYTAFGSGSVYADFNGTGPFG